MNYNELIELNNNIFFTNAYNVMNIDECIFFLHLKYNDDLIIDDMLRKIKKSLFLFKINDVVTQNMLDKYNHAINLFYETYSFNKFEVDYGILLDYLNPYNRIISSMHCGDKNILKYVKIPDSMSTIYDIKLNNYVNLKIAQKILYIENVIDTLKSRKYVDNGNITPICFHNDEYEKFNNEDLFYSPDIKYELSTDKICTKYKNLDNVMDDIEREVDYGKNNILEKYAYLDNIIEDIEKEVIHKKNIAVEKIEKMDTEIMNNIYTLDEKLAIYEKQLEDKDMLNVVLQKNIEKFLLENYFNSEEFKEGIENLFKTSEFKNLIINIIRENINTELSASNIISDIKKSIDINEQNIIAFNDRLDTQVHKCNNIKENMNNIITDVNINKQNINETNDRLTNNFIKVHNVHEELTKIKNTLSNNIDKIEKLDYEISKILSNENFAGNEIYTMQKILSDEKLKTNTIMHFLNIDTDTLKGEYNNLNDIYLMIMKDNKKLLDDNNESILDEYNMLKNVLPDIIMDNLNKKLDEIIDIIILENNIDKNSVNNSSVISRLNTLINKIRDNDMDKIREEMQKFQSYTVSNIKDIRDDIIDLVYNLDTLTNENNDYVYKDELNNILTQIKDINNKYDNILLKLENNDIDDNHIKTRIDFISNYINNDIKTILFVMKSNLMNINSFLYNQFSRGNIPNYIRESENKLRGYAEMLNKVIYIINSMENTPKLDIINIPPTSDISSTNIINQDLNKIQNYNKEYSAVAGINCNMNTDYNYILKEIYNKFVNKYYIYNKSNLSRAVVDKLNTIYIDVINKYSCDTLYINKLIYELFDNNISYNVHFNILIKKYINIINHNKNNFILNLLKRYNKKCILIYSFKKIVKHYKNSNIIEKFIKKLIINFIKYEIIYQYIVNNFDNIPELSNKNDFIVLGIYIIKDFIYTLYFKKIKSTDDTIYALSDIKPKNDIFNLDHIYSIDYLAINKIYKKYFIYALNFKRILFILYSYYIVYDRKENVILMINYLIKRHININKYFRAAAV
jgi:hypothetical protein